MTLFQLGENRLDAHTLVNLALTTNPPVNLPEASRNRLKKYRAVVDGVLERKEVRYGINTGFGYLAKVRIEESRLADLQLNLVRSHACGVGPAISDELVRALLVIRAHTFSLGHSGISPECVEMILKLLQHDILPMVPCKGSVGASGDLAPLAHLALGVLGEGRVRQNEKMLPAKEALQKAGVKPHVLQAKEGLSLINGTHFMAVLGAFAVVEAQNVITTADIAAAMSLDAIRGTVKAFDPRIHNIRPQSGQKKVAQNILKMFSGHDEILESHASCDKVQDPYSFRCVPQVHGASRDAWDYVQQKIDIELNSVTDNPLCFEDGDILSGGNFHGQPMALSLDFLTMAVAEIGSISERRIEKLTNPHMSGLPAFLVKDSGLHSGYMIPHVVAAALASENKVLSHPAVVDTIPTSADQEDHVSMGPISGRKCREVINNVAHILAIELLAACQGLDLLKPLKPSPTLAAVYDAVRKISPAMEADRALSDDIGLVKDWILSGGAVNILKEQGIDLR